MEVETAASGRPARTGDMVTDAAATEEGLLDRRARWHGPSGGKVGNKGGRRHCLVTWLQWTTKMRYNATINPQGSGHMMNYEQPTYPVRRLGKDEEEKEMPSFSSSSFDAATTTTT